MKILLSVAVLLAMTAGSAIAQQKATLQPGDVWFLLGAKAVQNDLEVSDEVASKLNSLSADARAAKPPGQSQRLLSDARMRPAHARLGQLTLKRICELPHTLMALPDGNPFVAVSHGDAALLSP